MNVCLLIVSNKKTRGLKMNIDQEQQKIIKHMGYLRNHMRMIMEDFRPLEKRILITKQEGQLLSGAIEKFEELNTRLVKFGDKQCYLNPWEKKCRATKFFRCIVCKN